MSKFEAFSLVLVDCSVDCILFFVCFLFVSNPLSEAYPEHPETCKVENFAIIVNGF